MKTSFVVAAIGLVALLLLLVRLPDLLNRGVVAELANEPDGERAQKVMMIQFPSGKRIPVNYLREGERVYAGADGPWWRELRGDGAAVELVIRGETLRGHARAVEDDPEHTRDVFSRLRPSVPAWLPSWLDGILVEIELSGPSAASPATAPAPSR